MIIFLKWSEKNHSAKQFSFIYTQGRHKIMAPKNFVLDLISTPLNPYPVLGDVRDVTSSRISHEQTQSNRVKTIFQLSSFTVFPKDPFFRLFSLFYCLLETPNPWLYPVIWNSFKIWDIYTLMRPVLYENKGWGISGAKKLVISWQEKDTLTLFHFGMNAAGWVKQ